MKQLFHPLSTRILALLVVFSQSFGFAQEQLQDVVYLKNGSIIRGDIIEQIPNKTIKVKTSDGSVFVYSMNDIERITKEQRISASSDIERKPLGNFGLEFNPLGILQFGPTIKTEFKVSPTSMIGPHIRFASLGALMHAVSDYDRLTSAMAFGFGIKWFLGEEDQRDRFVGGVFLEYGYGEGTDWSVYYQGSYREANYKFEYINIFGCYGYRWRYTSPFFMGLDIVAGIAPTIADYRISPSRVDYPLTTHFFAMLEFNIGYEK